MRQASAVVLKDPQAAAALEAEAGRTPWGIYLYRRDQFYSVLKSQPLLGLVYDTNLPFDEQYLFKKLYTLPVGGNSADYDAARIEVLDVALSNTAGLMRGMAAEAL